MPRNPECTCGECRACKQRPGHRRHYENHRESEIRRAVELKRKRRGLPPRGLSPEVSDEELDRRALEMMGRQPDAR